MKNFKNSLLSTATVLPLALGMATGLAVLGSAVTGGADMAIASCNPCNPCAAAKPCNPCAAAKPCNPCNPCAAAKPCNPCNPCAAAKPCNPCNPCAAAKPCNPCNPCAAAKPCNPCAANSAAVSQKCFVPRLKTAAADNPCATKNPCNPCTPCAAAKPCNPCKPCAAAKPCNPCNPCAAAKPCNPCNPCAAAKPCNPCNPCAAAKPCNPCNPCAASAADVDVTEDELKSVYDCLKPELVESYGKAGILAARRWGKWSQFATVSYRSDTHGGRFVNNYANSIAEETYGKFEQVKRMPTGSMLAKDSFVVNADGTVAPGPLFTMEKMTAGFNDATANWRYAMVMPDGSLFGITGGKNASGLQFCHDCHVASEDNDMMMFMPEEYRKK